MTKEERSALETLDEIVRSDKVRTQLRPIIERIRALPAATITRRRLNRCNAGSNRLRPEQTLGLVRKFCTHDLRRRAGACTDASGAGCSPVDCGSWGRSTMKVVRPASHSHSRAGPYPRFVLRF
jgi:hypothetical protein